MSTPFAGRIVLATLFLGASGCVTPPRSSVEFVFVAGDGVHGGIEVFSINAAGGLTVVFREDGAKIAATRSAIRQRSSYKIVVACRYG